MLTQLLVSMLVMQSSGIEGQVRDSRTHHEIPSAKVDVSSSRIPIDRQYTDRRGLFRFGTLGPGSYMFLVESSGYDQAAVKIDVVPPRTSGFVIVELVRKQTPPLERPEVVPLNQYTIPNAARKE